jgi:hypothetical protein
MEWGEYLARGISSESSFNISSPATTASPKPFSEDHSEEIIRLVEKYFQQEGATIFSSKIAVGYLQVRHPHPSIFI